VANHQQVTGQQFSKTLLKLKQFTFLPVAATNKLGTGHQLPKTKFLEQLSFYLWQISQH
jgi:hypothetical protein